MIGIVFTQIIKDLQEPLIQNFFRLFGRGCVAQTNTLRIAEKLFIKMSLRLVIASNARSNDCIKVVLVKRYFSSEEQS